MVSIFYGQKKVHCEHWGNFFFWKKVVKLFCENTRKMGCPIFAKLPTPLVRFCLTPTPPNPLKNRTSLMDVPKCKVQKLRFQKDFILIVICTLFILLLRRIQKFWQCIRLLGNWAWKNMFGFLFWNLLLCRMELPELYDWGTEGSFQKFAICYLFVFARGYVPIYSC